MRKKRWRTAALTMGLVMWAMGAQADYATALKHYEAKKFPVAFAEFKRLAELGDAPSQRILAAMYSNGDGVERNLVEAWAWAKLASDRDPQAQGFLPLIEKGLAENDLAMAQQRASALHAQYGAQAIAQSLLPVPAEKGPDCEIDTGVLGSDSKKGARPIETLAPQYPPVAAQNGIMGSVCFRFILDAEGHPKLITPYMTQLSHSSRDPSMGKAFQQASERAIRKWKFKSSGKPDVLRYCMDYRLDGADQPAVTLKRRSEINALKEAATAGDSAAQFDLATAYDNLYWYVEDSSKYKSPAASMIRTLRQSAAINGHAPAQLKVGLDLLSGNQCEQDVRKGVVWLTMAAQQGNADAAYVLAERLLSGEGVAVDQEKSFEWLKAAAIAGHSVAQLRLAVRQLQANPAQAEQVLMSLPPPVAELKDPADMLFLEVRALAAAHASRFEDAVQVQARVTAVLDEMGYRDSAQHQRLQRYREAKVVSAQEFPDLLFASATK